MLSITYYDFSLMVSRLFKDLGSERENIMHAAVGVAGEGGELLDAAKKHWAYNKSLDRENIKEEIGDALFYLEAMCQRFGWSLEDAMKANIDKLGKRYGTGQYSDAQAQARADKTGEQA